MSAEHPTPTDPSRLPDELAGFCRDDRPKIVAVIARSGPERFAVTTALLRDVASPGVVVATSDGADAYREFFKAARAGSPSQWTVLEGGDSEGGIRAVARALDRARDLIAEPIRDESLSALWLPAHIVEAFGLLPADGTGLVVIDSWDGLLSEYLPEAPPAPDSWPSHEELEQILVRTLRTYARAFVVVIVDPSSRSRIADLADGIVEVVARGQYGVLAGSILVTRKDGTTRQRESVRFHLESGVIRWQVNR